MRLPMLDVFPRILLLIAVAATAALTSGDAHAQLDNELMRAFDASGNVTSPQAAMTARRGIITLGGMAVRSPIVNPPNFVNFQPPSVSAGCGGIDLVGGSMSFISADAFVDYLRAIASNAAGYAFQLSLGTMCNKCQEIIDKLQKLTQDINNWSKSSCEYAQMAVDKGIAAWSERKGAAAQQEAGNKTDEYAASQNDGQGAMKGLTEEQLAGLVANFTYKAMKEQKFGDWFGGSGNDDLIQDLMSVTGTLVGCVAGEEGCPEVEGTRRPGEYSIQPFSGTLTLRDLVYGSGTDGEGVVTVLRCEDKEKCLVVKTEQVKNYKSIRDNILTALLGTPEERALGQGGMIGKIEAKEPPTEAELRVLNAAGDLGAYITTLVGGDPRAARSFVSQFADPIAATFVHNEMQMLLDSVGVAVHHSGKDPQGEVYTLIANAKSRLYDDWRAILEQTNARDSMTEQFERLMRAIPRVRFVGVDEPAEVR